jgi:DNA polymerase I-like protein with 3'-5' exonuclease and polymerase domains
MSSSFERDVMNTPIQGTGADICKSSFLSVYQHLHQNNLLMKVNIIALIHDELIIKIPKKLATNSFLNDLCAIISGSFNTYVNNSSKSSLL